MPYEFKFPDVGEGITEGEIVKWKVNEGDKVKVDQILGEIETDKAVVEIPSPRAGVILKIHVKEGGTVKVGEILVTIVESGEEISKDKTPKQKGEKSSSKKSVGVVGELEEAPEEEDKKTAEPSRKTVLPAKTSGTEPVYDRGLALPRVRAMASKAGIDLRGIKGSGPGGRILESDIKFANRPIQAQPQAQTQTQATALTVKRKYDMYGYVDRIPLKGIRKAIAEKMVQSAFTAPHVTHMDEVDVTDLWAHREKEKKKAEKKGVKLTLLPFIVKALIKALGEYPRFNAELNEETQEIIIKKYYNIGVAVDTENGLMVPVVKRAETKNVLDIAKEISELAEKSRTRKIDLLDLKDSSITITNYGSIGGVFATPIINYPDVAILGVGRMRDKPVVLDGKIVARKILPLSLSFDHRVADGAEAARFVNRLKEILEDIDLLLME